MSDFIEAAQVELFVLFKLDASQRKYDSPQNQEIIIERLRSYRVTPSETGCRRAIAELLAENAIDRVDGGNAATDETAARAREQAKIDRVANAPLTERDFDGYSRMAPNELEAAYYGDPVFAERYRRACAEWGFRIPAKSRNPTTVPVRRTTAIPPTEQAAPVSLTAAEYRSLPVAVVQAKFRKDPAFRAAVQKLIDEERI
jgi:hypothetical protein